MSQARAPRRRTFRPDAEALAVAAFRSAYDPARPIEEQFRALWREIVAAKGGRSWHIGNSRGSDPDWPDESTIIGKRILFLELKAPGKKPTEGQRECLRLLAGAGQEAYLVTSTGDRGRDLIRLTSLAHRAQARLP